MQHGETKRKKCSERLWDMKRKEKSSTVYLIGVLEGKQRDTKEDDFFFFLDNGKNLP